MHTGHNAPTSEEKRAACVRRQAALKALRSNGKRIRAAIAQAERFTVKRAVERVHNEDQKPLACDIQDLTLQALPARRWHRCALAGARPTVANFGATPGELR